MLHPSSGKKLSLFSSSSAYHPLSHAQGKLAGVLGTGTCNTKDFTKWEAFHLLQAENSSPSRSDSQTNIPSLSWGHSQAGEPHGTSLGLIIPVLCWLCSGQQGCAANAGQLPPSRCRMTGTIRIKTKFTVLTHQMSHRRLKADSGC